MQICYCKFDTHPWRGYHNIAAFTLRFPFPLYQIRVILEAHLYLNFGILIWYCFYHLVCHNFVFSFPVSLIFVIIFLHIWQFSSNIWQNLPYFYLSKKKKKERAILVPVSPSSNGISFPYKSNVEGEAVALRPTECVSY